MFQNVENESPEKENSSKKLPTPDKDLVEEDDSNSTFVLPPEFVADCNSDDSLNFDTVKRKTVEIKQDSSLEIFEKDPDHSICIDVIKIQNSPISLKSASKSLKSPSKSLKSPLKSSKITKADNIFKFSPLGKELVDVEYFKKEYLNEVGFTKAESSQSLPNIPTEVDSDVKLSNNCQNDVNLSKNDGNKKSNCKNDKKGTKRHKSDVPKEKVGAKKRKVSESYKFTPLINNENEVPTKNKSKRRKKNNKFNKNLKITFDSKSKRKRNKLKTKLSVENKNIKLKIKWKKEQLHFKLESKSEKSKKNRSKSQKSPSNLKQYVLQYPTEGKSNGVLVKPEKDVNRLKRKYIKQEKSPDKFKQTSLHNFFILKSEK